MGLLQALITLLGVILVVIGILDVVGHAIIIGLVLAALGVIIVAWANGRLGGARL